MYRHREVIKNGKSYDVVTLNGRVIARVLNRFGRARKIKIALKVVLCASLLALSGAAAQAQGFVDRIVRPCPSGSPQQASVIVNPNSSGDVKATTCSGGTFDVNGVSLPASPIGGSGTVNTVPYFSAATTLASSPSLRGGSRNANG